MVRLIRIVGVLMIVAGALVLLTWIIKPLRFIWPWLRMLPWPIQLGIGVAAAGFTLLFGTLLWERFEEREQDRGLRDE
jgi:hypothetical protein